MTNYTKKSVRGAGITLILSILASAIAYVTRIILARNLTPEEYGLFYAVFTFVIFFLFFRDLGLGQALVKYIAEFKALGEKNNIKTAIVSVFTFQFISSVIFGTVFFFLADFLGEHYFKNPQAAFILKILILYVLFSILFVLVKSIFNGFQRMFLFSSVEFMKNGLVLALIIIFFKWGYGIFTPVWAYALVPLLLFLIYVPFVLITFHFFRYKIVDFGKITKKLFLFGLPVFMTDIGGMIVSYLDVLILVHYRTLTEVGIYNVVLPSALIFLFFSKAVGAIVLPVSSELWVKKDQRRLSEGLRLLHRYLFVVMIPVILTAAFFARFLITAFFGSDYAVGYLAFQILVVGVLFYVVAAANNNLIAGIGKPKTVTVIILLSALVNIILNIILIPQYGIEGAAIATTVSYFLMLILSTVKAIKYIGAKFPGKEWLSLLFPAGAFLGMIYVVEKSLSLNTWLEIVIAVIVAGTIYLLLAYILKLINVTELKRYLRLVR